MNASRIDGWLVEYEKPWWYAEKPGTTPFRAGTRAVLRRSIERYESRKLQWWKAEKA